MMEISKALLKNIDVDLNINAPYSKGAAYPVRNCWHFSTDGNYIDQMFANEDDFVNGMNRIFTVLQKYRVLIFAFALMDTHVHFILYGMFDQCNRFIHDYVKRTSMYISSKYNDRKKMAAVPVRHQAIDDDLYLKTAICYVLKNPLVAGLHFNYFDYPWSSGALYFRKGGMWSSPVFCLESNMKNLRDLGFTETRELLKSHAGFIAADCGTCSARVINGLVHPGDYVAVDIVERIFRTPRSFHYFMSRTKDEDVESRGGAVSRLSIPISEMRQNRDTLCRELFGTDSPRKLNTSQRLRLAKTLKSRYNSSGKQIAKICGLLYDEVKNML